MNSLPDAVILVGLPSQLTVVKECKKMTIPLIGIVDTNCDPFLMDFFIPANDDSLSSVSLIFEQFRDALIS